MFTLSGAHYADPAALVGRLAEGARAASGLDSHTFAREVDRRAALTHALMQTQADDCVVLTGMGIEDTLTVGNTMRQWDEAAIARRILRDLSYPGRTDQGEQRG